MTNPIQEHRSPGAPDESAPEESTTPQHTLARPVSIRGRGLLLGEETTATIEPAGVGEGITFERVDLEPSVRIQAIVDNAVDRARRTTLRSGDTTVETVEHLLSALAGLGVDNANIKLDGAEVPSGDGSALPFVEPILEAGLVEQDAPRRIYRVVEPVLLQDDHAMIAAFPSEEAGLHIVYDLDYGGETKRIARQTQSFSSGNGSYITELAPARTYSLREEAEALQSAGMCTHLTPADVLVIGDDGPIENTYRFENEPVRHKVLDLIGDLSLAGGAVEGRVVASRSGHSLNRRLCRAIVEQAALQHRRETIRSGKVMDVRTIQRIMPHRYPMLLVDRVVEMDKDQRAVGIKNVTINEPFFQGHYPGTPIMPGVLVVEAMAQLGGLLMSRKLEHTGKIAVLLSLDRVKLRHPVAPGDQLVMEAVSIRAGKRTASLQCRGWVGSKLAAEAQVRFMMVDAEQD